MSDDDDTDAGGDIFIDLLKVLVAFFFFCLAMLGIVSIVWALIA